MPTRPRATRQGAADKAASRRPWWHMHWFRRVGDDPFSSASLYACRCGVVRPGF